MRSDVSYLLDIYQAATDCHPADDRPGKTSGTHNISFYCDDIEKTVTELKARGVDFTDGITEQGYGLVTHFRMPGDIEVDLYQPHYQRNPSNANVAGSVR